MSDEVKPVPPAASEAGAGKQPVYGPALCLSGGGFRATLFHLGALIRLNELGVLPGLDVITSVSGGSITNGVLATRWSSLNLGPGGVFTNFDEVVCRPVRDFCAKDLRTPLLLGPRLDFANLGVLIRNYFSVPANYLAGAYQALLRQRLAELPQPGKNVPRSGRGPPAGRLRRPPHRPRLRLQPRPRTRPRLHRPHAARGAGAALRRLHA